MTTITFREGIMAADSRMTLGGAVIGNVVKIVRRDDGALCGGCGRLAWLQAFHEWFLNGEQDDLPDVDEDSMGLIARPKKPLQAFEEAGTYEWKTPYFAMGSGRRFALGAMYAGASAQEAVKAAIKFDIYSGGKVISLSHDG